MMGEEAGWYRDPAPPNPAAPTTLRFWDGMQWTAQVKPASKRQRLAWQAEDAEARRAYAMEQAELRAQQAQQTQSHPGSLQVAASTMVVEVSRDFTPDGDRLAGWGRRLSAYVLDYLILTVLLIAFGWHFLATIVSAYMNAVNQMAQAQNAGQQPAMDPIMDQLTSAAMPAVIELMLVSMVLNFCYVVGFLMAFQATPGKMVLGMQVRLRNAPGPLSWGTVLLRWGTQIGYGYLGLIPLVGAFTSVYGLLDNLWPLWDGKRQALHDKASRTNVVYLR